MAFFSDTFTDTDAVQLENHTPDVGTSWTSLWKHNVADIFTIVSNQCKGLTGANRGVIYTGDATPPSADYDVTFTLVDLTASGTDPLYIFVRIQDQENMYAVRLMTGVTVCQLYKKVSGTWSALGSLFDEPADGSVCRLEIIGSTLKFYDDGVEVASASDSDISAAGKLGVGAGGGTELVSSTDDIRAHIIDTLSGNDLAAGGTVNTETGQVTSPEVLAGIDQAVFGETGAPKSPSVLAGVDQNVFSETGQAASPSVLSGAKAFELAKTGTAAGLAALSGSDQAVFSETGQASSPSVLSGAKAADLAKTGQVASPEVLAGADQSIFSETVNIASPEVLGGTKAFVLAKTGSLQSPAVLGGVSEYTPAGSVTYTKTGTLQAPEVLAGVDQVVYSETGSPQSPAVLAGTDQAIFGETVSIASPAVLGGTQVFVSGSAAQQEVYGTGTAGEWVPVPFVIEVVKDLPTRKPVYQDEEVLLMLV